MTRRVFSALIVLLASATGAVAQESAILGNGGAGIINKGYLRLGAGVYFEMEGTTNDAFEFQLRIDPTEDIIWNLPATSGSAGTQLTTNGSANATITWAAAGSKREYKDLTGYLTPQEALRAVLAAPVHRFHYKNRPGAVTTGDFSTEYVGIVADEAPWAMHFGGTILNPINTAGYTIGAIQALEAELAELKAQLAAQHPVTKRTWRTLWLWATKE